jgi:hypothetical protein
MKKIEGSGAGVGSGSGSADPSPLVRDTDPYQNVTDPQHFFKGVVSPPYVPSCHPTHPTHPAQPSLAILFLLFLISLIFLLPPTLLPPYLLTSIFYLSILPFLSPQAPFCLSTLPTGPLLSLNVSLFFLLSTKPKLIL